MITSSPKPATASCLYRIFFFDKRFDYAHSRCWHSTSEFSTRLRIVAFFCCFVFFFCRFRFGNHRPDTAPAGRRRRHRRGSGRLFTFSVRHRRFFLSRSALGAVEGNRKLGKAKKRKEKKTEPNKKPTGEKRKHLPQKALEQNASLPLFPQACPIFFFFVLPFRRLSAVVFVGNDGGVHAVEDITTQAKTKTKASFLFDGRASCDSVSISESTGFSFRKIKQSPDLYFLKQHTRERPGTEILTAKNFFETSQYLK